MSDQEKDSKQLEVPKTSLFEYRQKVEDGRERLNINFCCFLKVGDNRYFITGGDELAAVYSSDNFVAMIVGASSSDIDIGRGFLKSVASEVSSSFDQKDFHATVARYYLTRILRSHLSSKANPVALAVEYMIYDIFGRLIVINLNGDYRSMLEDELDDELFFVGCHKDEFRKIVTAEISEVRSVLGGVKISQKQIVKLADRIKKKIGLQYIEFNPIIKSSLNDSDIVSEIKKELEDVE